MKLREMLLTSALGTALLVIGCERAGDPSDGATAAAGGGPSWILASLPEGAVDVAAAKKAVREGEEVVVRGRIGGRVDAISEGVGVFVMMDPAIPSCAEIPGDNCATPWDYCCETPESLSANNATVQLVDASGTPLATDLTSHGLAPLDTVVVVGTVAPRPSDAVLVIRAKGIYKQ